MTFVPARCRRGDRGGDRGTAIHGEGRSRVTIDDVAEVAGVSAATVSRVFSGGNSVAATTRDRVLAVADSLGFRLNPLTRSLSSRTSDMVAVMLPHVRNLSVVGFDDVLPARFIVPALRTVRQDATGLSERAVQAIVSPEGRDPRHTLVLPVSLVIRGSTGLPPKGSAASRRRNRGANDRRH